MAVGNGLNCLRDASASFAMPAGRLMLRKVKRTTRCSNQQSGPRLGFHVEGPGER